MGIVQEGAQGIADEDFDIFVLVEADSSARVFL
jgi:hypothetical protein